MYWVLSAIGIPEDPNDIVCTKQETLKLDTQKIILFLISCINIEKVFTKTRWREFFL